MGHAVIGVPTGLIPRSVTTPDGTFERIEFTMAHPLDREDKYKDIFEVGATFAPTIKEAAKDGKQVVLYTGYGQSFTLPNGDKKYVTKVTAVEAVE